MLPELNIEGVFRRELDALPIPAESLWVPVRSSVGGTFLLRTALIVVTALLVGGAVFAVRDARESGVAEPGPRATVPPRPTCLPNGVCIAPVPIMVRSQDLGYNLWLPGDWRETAVTGPTAPGLVSRRVFTARYPEDEVAAIAAARGVPAWDFLVEVWDRQGRPAAEFARTGTCTSSLEPTCELSTQTLRGELAVVTTVSLPGGRYTRSYYIEHAEKLLILRYVVDPAVDRPSQVSEQTLEQIVRMIGLV